MAEFSAMDTAAFKGVWVFCEQREGKLMPTDFELISEGRKLADDLGVELCGLLLGDKVEGLAKELGGYGADRIIVCEHPLLKDYTTDGYAKALCDLIMDKKPEIMLIGATNLGRDLGPRCAARLHTGLTADCTHLDVDVEKYKNFLRTTSNIDVDNTKFEENTNLKMTRPAFGGHLMATIICPRFRPQMSTVRPGVMQMQAFDQAGADKVVVENVAPALTADDIHVQVLDIKKSAEKLVDLMGMETVAIDLTDESWYGYLAGLTADNVDKVDAAVVSEPMTGSQAYSLVLLRLKDKANAREIADSMEENISMRKWVCVEADKARVVSFDDKLLYVMADSELVDVDLLADAAAKAFGATFDVDDSLVNEDESELPPELLSAPAVAD